MLENSTEIKVTNRDNGAVGYAIPDLGNLHRTFQAGEEKIITMEELRKLSWIPGGRNILKNYLLIENEEAVQELLGEVEPEYFYTSDDVKELLLNGSLDQLKDTLDYAPEGTIDLVKNTAVDLEINDISKRNAIQEATGFNVTTAVNINREAKAEEGEVEEAPKRRAQPISKKATKKESGRRTTAPAPRSYNVINKD